MKLISVGIYSLLLVHLPDIICLLCLCLFNQLTIVIAFPDEALTASLLNLLKILKGISY